MNSPTHVVVVLSTVSGFNVIVAVETAEAERLFAQFASEKLPSVIGHHNVKCAPPVTPWQIPVKHLACITVATPQQVQQLQAQAQNKSAVTPGPFPSLGAVRYDKSGFPMP